jgi:hypothetical protein
MKLLKLNEKFITQDIIVLLKHELNHDLVTEFVKERYNNQNVN